MNQTGLLICNDLIFSTKVTGTAQQLGLNVRVVSTPDAALDRLRADPPKCVLLDLSHPALTAESMQAIVQAAGAASVLAYGSHVDTERLELARAAGCTDVMPRSRFAGTLPQILQQYLGSSNSVSNDSDKL